ncbi:hypothetical protein J6590_028871 [Homalodisca vitripennis]|nr:hypothetical protein J6590_028871 [Homalodisca vitripennis]
MKECRVDRQRLFHQTKSKTKTVRPWQCDDLGLIARSGRQSALASRRCLVTCPLLVARLTASVRSMPLRSPTIGKISSLAQFVRLRGNNPCEVFMKKEGCKNNNGRNVSIISDLDMDRFEDYLYMVFGRPSKLD